ncbi:MAG: DUF4442 domain-containing protein [Gammaproteobacteria bacterium]|nr:DUF4442 domain-containing protein [Gammaproteobacteria bacterium]
MAFSNRLIRALAPVERLPAFMRTAVRSYAIGRVIKFVGTAGIRIEELTQEKSLLRLPNRRRVQNHIGGVHAAATSLLAESATGLVVGMNLPDSRIPLFKSMHINYVRRAAGGLTAEARLTESDRQRIRNEEKGDVTVQVHVTDANGDVPVECEMVWAWIPKR